MSRYLSVMVCASCLAAAFAWAAESNTTDYTCFQTAAPYAPELDIGSDVAVVYGVDETFAGRVAGWREHGYTAAMMTGISWGGYGDYYFVDGQLKRDEIQTVKNGDLLMHGDSTTVGYNVPSPAYVEYIKKRMDPAVDAGVSAIYLEEPEFWARAGWSEAFKKEWQRFYGEPWQAPDSSPTPSTAQASSNTSSISMPSETCAPTSRLGPARKAFPSNATSPRTVSSVTRTGPS